MNAIRRTSLVALLAVIPLAVMTGCSTSTPGSANPAATTASATSVSASPSVNPPNSVTSTPPQAKSTTTPPTATEPSSPEPSSQESISQEPITQEPTTQEAGPTGPDLRPTDLGGEVYGFIRAVDVARSKITLDKVDWFAGTDAEQACKADRVPAEAHLDGWCSIYYYRNVNPKLRVVSVSADAAIATLRGTTPVSADLQTLADRSGSPGGNYYLYRITVTDGAIVGLTQIYQP